MAGLQTNGMPRVTPGSSYPAVTGYETVVSDTNLASGENPQTVAATTFQIAALAAAITKNTASATAGAATLNTEFGVITSESLSTAAGASYTLTLTNSLVTSASNVQASVYAASETAGPEMQLVSVVPGSGSVVLIAKNNGTAALNGTLVFPFQVS